VHTFHRELFSKYVTPLLEFKELNCSEPVPIGDFNAVQSLCGLYDAFAADPDSGIDKSTSATTDGYLGLAEKWFVLACIWSVCAAVDEKVSSCYCCYYCQRYCYYCWLCTIGKVVWPYCTRKCVETSLLPSPQ
jgi:Dynein heavy chain AAA lid domain